MKTLKNVLVCALAAALFVVTLTACGPNLLTNGGEGTGSSTPVSDAGSEPAESGSSILDELLGSGGSSDTEGGIGDTLSNIFFDYTVLSAEGAAEYDGYAAAEGNRLIICSVKVKNTFDGALPMYDADFQLQWGQIGGDDDDYTYSLDAFNDTMMPLEYELAVGEEVTYDLVYEVPADETDFGLVYLEEYTTSDGTSETGEFYSVNFTVE